MNENFCEVCNSNLIKTLTGNEAWMKEKKQRPGAVGG